MCGIRTRPIVIASDTETAANRAIRSGLPCTCSTFSEEPANGCLERLQRRRAVDDVRAVELRNDRRQLVHSCGPAAVGNSPTSIVPDRLTTSATEPSALSWWRVIAKRGGSPGSAGPAPRIAGIDAMTLEHERRHLVVQPGAQMHEQRDPSEAEHRQPGSIARHAPRSIHPRKEQPRRRQPARARGCARASAAGTAPSTSRP